MSKVVELCNHVTLTILPKDGDTPSIVEVKGVAYPFFGWDPKLQADVPWLKCSYCGKSARVMGRAVRPQRAFVEMESA